jgi:hypothetical protein
MRVHTGICVSAGGAAGAGAAGAGGGDGCSGSAQVRAGREAAESRQQSFDDRVVTGIGEDDVHGPALARRLGDAGMAHHMQDAAEALCEV